MDRSSGPGLPLSLPGPGRLSSSSHQFTTRSSRRLHPPLPPPYSGSGAVARTRRLFIYQQSGNESWCHQGRAHICSRPSFRSQTTLSAILERDSEYKWLCLRREGRSAPPMRHPSACWAGAQQTGLNETHHHFAVIKGGRLRGFGPGQKFATPPVF